MSKEDSKALYNFIGHRIRQKRKELKLSQEKLSEMIGVDYHLIQRYEKGINKIPFDKLIKISKSLNTQLEYFYGDFEEKTKLLNKSSVVKYPESPELEKRIVAIKEIYRYEDEDLILGVNNCVDSMSAILKKRQEQRRDIETVKKTRVGRAGKK